MQQNRFSDISNFFIAGISYRNADAGTRSRFAVNDLQYENLLNLAPAAGLESLFILSTCNRTEIYGFAENAGQLVALLTKQTKGTAAALMQLAYIKNGLHAVGHLFNVGAGLDSQILGDYEIVGQLKRSVKFSKDRGFIDGFLERLVNCVLQTSKIIKNQTALSAGTVSVSFAAVQYIKTCKTYRPGNTILVLGTGKIGQITCKNLVDYLGTKNITLINRSEEKAVQLASELGLNYAPFSQLDHYLACSDIILTSTNAAKPIITRRHLENQGDKLVIDLSIPYNVSPSVSRLSNIHLVNVDELSSIKEGTLQQRRMEAVKAKAIIADHIARFREWYAMRKNVPMLKVVKDRLNAIAAMHNQESGYPKSHCPVVAVQQKIQQVINMMAGKMHRTDQAGCQFIEAINEFIMAVES